MTIEKDKEGSSRPQSTDWDDLAKKVPFGGWGSEERQKLGEAGRIETTGAIILNDNGEVTGIVPNLPKKYEKSNMKYEKTIGGELEFIDNYIADKTEAVKQKHERIWRTQSPDWMSLYDEQKERERKLEEETEYVSELSYYFRSTNETQKNDLALGDAVFEKISSDIAAIRDEKEDLESYAKENGIINDVIQGDLDEYNRKIATRRRIYKALREKFVHDGKFEEGNVNYDL